LSSIMEVRVYSRLRNAIAPPDPRIIPTIDRKFVEDLILS
jgi:hypothetical protein